MKNVILIGLPGSGKTTFGMELAKRTGRRFFDLDKKIQERENLSIQEMFEQRGEEGFRIAESEAVKEIQLITGAVIACGGGVVLKEENMGKLIDAGLVVFLDRSVEQILESTDLTDRPLLRENPEYLHMLHVERYSLYNQYADIIITNQDPDKTMEQLVLASRMEETEVRLAVIGSPIGHSLSPKIHIPILERFYRQVSYLKRDVTLDGIEAWMQEAKDQEFNGFNVTMPLKAEILKYLDSVDEEAAAIGAVNTVVIADGKFHGSSTDGIGFCKALDAMERELKASRIAIIGAGGSASTLALRALREGASSILILGRDPSKAKALATRINEIAGASMAGYQAFDAKTELKNGIDILINTTPLGMTGTPEEFPSFAFLEGLRPETLLCDLVYDPEITKFLHEGENRGFPTMGGISMLLHQAVEADRRFVGLHISSSRACLRAIEQLKGRGERL